MPVGPAVFTLVHSGLLGVRILTVKASLWDANFPKQGWSNSIAGIQVCQCEIGESVADQGRFMARSFDLGIGLGSVSPVGFHRTWLYEYLKATGLLTVYNFMPNFVSPKNPED